MFLTTTADTRLWHYGGKILFLGEWCLLFKKRDEWSKLDYEVMDYPYDDRERLYRSYQYIRKAYDNLFPPLSETLNDIHGTSHSKRFWEITIGSWFSEYLEVLFERYICLKFASEKYDIQKTKTVDRSSWVTPDDTYNFDVLYKADLYNAQLYSQIIDHFEYFPHEAVSIERGRAETPGIFSWGHYESLPKQFIKWLSFLPSRWNRYFLITTRFPLSLLLKLSLKLKVFPLIDTPRLYLNFSKEPDKKIRARFADLPRHDEFEELVVKTLPVNLPKVYLENYGDALRLIRKYFPKKTGLILTGNSFGYNDIFKIWCAHQVERGVPYVIIQHGGNYGCALWNSTEDYEIRVSDRYLTYGWEDDKKGNVTSFYVNHMPSPRSTGVKGSQNGCILWALNSFPRYSYQMFSMPVASQVLDYLEQQGRFLKSLKREAREKLICRPYRYDYGWSDLERILEYGGGFQVKSTLLSMWRQLLTCRLFIGTYNSTAFLEAFVANVPTVIFWNPDHWELREEAKPYFEGLKSAGILYHDPVSAAHQVNSVFENSLDWWSQPHIQEVVKDFSERFARTSRKPVESWARMIKSLATRD